MILVIDNYDSFVHNLARYIREIGLETTVVRNDDITVDEIRSLSPDAIVLSPGPCGPQEAGICLEVVRALGADVPILGICLGHQAIGQAYGGNIGRAERQLHGKATPIYHDNHPLFEGLKKPFLAARYHSLIVDRQTLPDTLQVVATSEEGEIMALQHKQYPVVGFQFHPESILTSVGHQLLKNFFTASLRHHEN